MHWVITINRRHRQTDGQTWRDDIYSVLIVTLVTRLTTWYWPYWTAHVIVNIIIIKGGDCDVVLRLIDSSRRAGNFAAVDVHVIADVIGDVIGSVGSHVVDGVVERGVVECCQQVVDRGLYANTLTSCTSVSQQSSQAITLPLSLTRTLFERLDKYVCLANTAFRVEWDIK